MKPSTYTFIFMTISLSALSSAGRASDDLIMEFDKGEVQELFQGAPVSISLANQPVKPLRRAFLDDVGASEDGFWIIGFRSKEFFYESCRSCSLRALSVLLGKCQNANETLCRPIAAQKDGKRYWLLYGSDTEEIWNLLEDGR